MSLSTTLRERLYLVDFGAGLGLKFTATDDDAARARTTKLASHPQRRGRKCVLYWRAPEGWERVER